MKSILLFLCFLPAVLAESCSQIGPAVIKGKKFFDSNSGKYIAIKGVTYYPRPNEGEDSTGNNRDFFGENYRHVWERDIEEFQKLGINTLRLYAVDPGLDHSGFMCALKERGMYAIVGLSASCDGCAISSYDAPLCYSAVLKTRGQFIINVFSKYENVLGFDAGNEVQLWTPGEPPENNGVCQKQFIRDMRAYVQSCPTMRQIPIGVVVADVDRDANAFYYNCRSDPTDELENAEWYGLNVYLHCDGSAQTIADLDGYNGLLASHKEYGLSIPVVIAEFGCTSESFPTINGFVARDFLQVDAIFSSDFVDYFNGAVVFEYVAQKANIAVETDVPFPYSDVFVGTRWGIGYFLPEDCDDVSIPCTYTPYPEFDILASKYAAVDNSFVPSLNDFTAVERDASEDVCPANFTALSEFDWPSATVEDMACPGSNYTFICSGTPPECLPPFAQQPASTPPSTSDTTAPTEASSTSNTTAPTEASSTSNTTAPTKASSTSNTTAPTEEPMSTSPPPTVADDESPVAAPTSSTATTSDAPTQATPTMDDTPGPSLAPGNAPTATPIDFVPTAVIFPEGGVSSSAFYSSATLWVLSCALLQYVWFGDTQFR
jgi:hypothetical protein